jgi:hypothetical protein
VAGRLETVDVGLALKSLKVINPLQAKAVFDYPRAMRRRLSEEQHRTEGKKHKAPRRKKTEAKNWAGEKEYLDNHPQNRWLKWSDLKKKSDVDLEKELDNHVTRIEGNNRPSDYNEDNRTVDQVMAGILSNELHRRQEKNLTKTVVWLTVVIAVLALADVLSSLHLFGG